MSLPTVIEARLSMIEGLAAFPSESVALEAADGRWLAEDIHAARDQPPFASSAMDGWAVHAVDVERGARLNIIGESAAGHGLETPLRRGEAARIFTGAVLPPGADRVVLQEEATRHGDIVELHADPHGSRHVRAAGCDFRNGDRLLSAGDRLNPWRIALAAAAGRNRLACGAQIRVGILSTGDELVDPGRPATAHQIYNSTAPALAALVTRHAGRPHILASARDQLEDLMAAISTSGVDLMVTVGGASVGDHDLVRPAVRALGGQIRVQGVAMRPGKPVWFARLADGRPVLGLPGNPASALVCAELFLGPILATLQGGAPDIRFGTAILDGALPANGPRDHYIRAFTKAGGNGDITARPFADQDSSLVTVMAAANAFIRRPPHAPAAGPGEVVDIWGPASWG
ncbi:gephyrin-like molybdotransferase Glp [Brevundimonas sp.]|uniref:molybdopterin molybdotransferase MoeA n=1 Tax=Brevundimonas sp. TaxID=1871086 RepID=UPI00289DF703|nr:gephyrin-like molybdotransferase Glp [Brevundimonas sp.]